MTVLAFDGMRSVRGPLTLGQRIVRESLAQRSADADYTYNIDRVVQVPPGTEPAAVYAAVHALVRRHESLRTRFPAGAGEQVVDGDGSLAVRSADGVARARAELAAQPFDIAAEWGIRVAIVSRRDRPRAVVLCLSHLAVDAWAANLVADELAALLRGSARGGATPGAGAGPAAGPEPKPVLQPVDQAAIEAEPENVARRADALAHLRQVLLAAPAEPDDAGADPDAWHLGELRSTAVDPAAREVAARCRTTAAVVYLAAAGTALGDGPHVLKSITHNRVSPAETTCVAPFALDLFVPVDATGGTLEAVVARTWAAYVEAARHSRYDPAAVRPLVAEAAAERGTRPDLSVLVNDLRAGPRPPAPAHPAASTFRWGEPFRLPGLTRYLALADDGDAVVLSLLANGTALSRERIPAFLRRMEQAILTAAETAVTPAGPGGP
ncbi:Condensation domain-containing protein [Actinacidiphila yanglinensis]|uniref:Condensation domain-containing protein n=1 Tax=Actinacidiphila yanglinensis TaxID=310779 RepID=A0A1H6D8U5_9ACTN|nr:condensation domain-containing protein [Actinacidiphila yanglinensis]SEG80906.1 Condensation domain-containing protein [Actinacidiphila yanglinensis]